MAKSTWIWIRDSNEEVKIAHEARIRAHRERISKEMKRLGLREGTALKVCAVSGCLEETTITDKWGLTKTGWKRIRDQWFCREHANQQIAC